MAGFKVFTPGFSHQIWTKSLLKGIYEWDRGPYNPNLSRFTNEKLRILHRNTFLYNRQGIESEINSDLNFKATAATEIPQGFTHYLITVWNAGYSKPICIRYISIARVFNESKITTFTLKPRPHILPPNKETPLIVNLGWKRVTKRGMDAFNNVKTCACVTQWR